MIKLFHIISYMYRVLQINWKLDRVRDYNMMNYTNFSQMFNVIVCSLLFNSPVGNFLRNVNNLANFKHIKCSDDS